MPHSSHSLFDSHVRLGRPMVALALLMCLGALAPAAPAEPNADAAAARDGDTAADAVDLRPHFVAGRTARYEIWSLRHHAVTITSSLGPARRSQSREELTGQITWKVEKTRADGSATCLMTIDHLALTLTDDEGQTQVCDSRKASGDVAEVQALLKALAGQPLRFEVSADGTIGKVAGGDAVRRRAGDQSSRLTDLDFIETASELALLTAAPEAARLEKSWDGKATWNHELGAIHHDLRYTLASLEKVEGIPLATVTVAGKSRLELDKSKLPGGGAGGAADARVEARMTSGELASQVMIDLQRHEVAGRNTTETRQIEVKTRIDDLTIQTSVTQTLQTQALRIAED